MSEQNSERIESLVGISPRRLAILEEKARFFDMCEEARQVAGLLCFDIDILDEVASVQGMTAERLQKHIKRLKDNKDKMLNDTGERARRYASVQMLINCGALGADPRTAPQEPQS